MYTCVRVSSMAYYEMQLALQLDNLKGSTALRSMGANLNQQIASIAEGAGADHLAIDADGNAVQKPLDGSRKGAMDYYGADGVQGRWWSSRPTSTFHAERQPLVAHGAPVDARSLKMLSIGVDPNTGEQLRQKSKREKQTVGFDMQLSVPKPVSGMRALALGEALTTKDANAAQVVVDIDNAIQYANDRVMEYQMKHGLIITRQGKGGKEISGAAEIAIAQYRHHTSRSGDPHDHIHNVMMNVCLRPDGTTGTLDNYELLRHVGEIAAIHRCALTGKLRELRPEWGFERDERNFSIMGFPDDLAEKWSKRTSTIEEEMEANGWDKSKDRDAAINTNRNTRQDKSEQPPLHELATGRWRAEAASLGHSYYSVMERVAEAKVKAEREADEAYAKKREEAAAEGIDMPEQRPAYDIAALTDRALKTLTEFNSVFEDRIIKREIFEELQIYVGADEAEKIFDDIKASGKLVQIGVVGKMHDPVYSTAEIVERERELLRNVIEMKGNLTAIDPQLVESVIAAGRVINDEGDRAALRDEQAKAVRWSCGADQIAVVRGRAGAGKSFMYGAVTDVYHAAGYKVHGLAPSWKATGVLKEDTKLAEEYARAITGWINRVNKGEIVVDATTAILVDEAGMVGLDHMSQLVGLAKQTGARLILAGDERQLQPVAAGAPMKAIADLNGSAELAEIARQKIDWQRENSMALSNGQIADAINSYRMHGNIELHEDGKAALDALVADYRADQIERPLATRLILTTTNKDARTINLAVREQRKAMGELGQEFAAMTFSRGKNGKPTETTYAAGDRIIFGETLDVGADKIINNATATVLELKAREDGELQWRLLMDDGREIVATSSELVGYREEGSKERCPKIAHAYAMTVHSAQGMTVDKAYIYNANGLAKESAYVAMTRHRWDCKMYVDESRLVDKIAAERGVKMEISRTDGFTKELDHTSDGDVTQDDVIKELIAESSKSQIKLNVCDFQADTRIFALSRPNPAQEQGDGIADGQGGLKMTNNAFPDFGAADTTGYTLATPANDAGKKVEEDAARNAKEAALEAERAKAAAERPRSTFQAQRRFTGPKIEKHEIDTFAHADLGAYLESKGWKHLNDYKPRNGQHAAIYQLEFGGERAGKVSVLHKNDGTWSFAARDGSANGRIWDFIQWRQGGDQMDAWHQLRKEFGTSPDRQQAQAVRKPVEAVQPKDTRTDFEKFRDGIRDRIAESKAAQFVSSAYATVQKRWNMMQGGVNEYLEGRGITRETQRHFAEFIKTESRMSKQNPNGVCFKHSTLDGVITGYERKGPKHNPTDERSFSQFSATVRDENKQIVEGGNSSRRLGLMKTTDTPSRIYVSEVQIDGLSIWQADGSDKRAWIASTFGAPSSAGLADLSDLAKRYPQAEIHVATDNDTSGREFARQIEIAVQYGRGEQATVVDRRPADQFKDWNDQVMGKVWTQEEKAQDTNKLAALAAERQKAEAERQSRLQDANTPPPPPNGGQEAGRQPSAFQRRVALANKPPEERERENEERRKRQEEYERKQIEIAERERAAREGGRRL